MGGPDDTIENMNITYGVRGSKLLLATLAELANSNIGSLPMKPDISGSEEGDIDEELTFSTSTTDPNNLQVSYMWNWGDGSQTEWSDLFDSGETVSASHSWNEEGIYPIKVKARNSDNLESEWSNAFMVGIPQKKEGVDQKQITHGGHGYGTWNGGQFAQSFIPSVDTITKVSLLLFKQGDPPGAIVSIRSDLNGRDLTSAYLSGTDIQGQLEADWYEFNFPEIEITPGETYYIIWTTPYGGSTNDAIYWTFGDKDPYPKGSTWANIGYAWEELEIPDTDEPDFCFKTYYAATKPRVRASNTAFLNMLSSYSNLFSILKIILQRLG
jgi:hypothetical protein